MKISIASFPVFMRLGCFAQEKLSGQEVLVSVQLELQESFTAAASDELAQALDYGAVLEAINALLADKELNLIESAVAILGAGLLQRFSLIKMLEVEIIKPILPNGINKGAQVSVSHTFRR